MTRRKKKPKNFIRRDIREDFDGDEQRDAEGGFESTLWFRSRPPAVQEAIRKYPPGRRWRRKSDGSFGTIIAYTEMENECTECIFVPFPDGRYMESDHESMWQRDVPLSDLEDTHLEVVP